MKKPIFSLIFLLYVFSIVTQQLFDLFQEKPELSGHPSAAVSRRQTAELLRHLAALHTPVLARRPQLQTGYGYSGESKQSPLDRLQQLCVKHRF